MSPRGIPDELPDDLATLWQLTRRVSAEMDRRSEAICRAELQISFAQFLVLSVVDAHPGPLSQQTIADRLGLTKGTVSRQLDAAVADGLMVVEVSPHSRRENVVTLTPAGTSLVRRGDDALAPARDAARDAVKAADLKTAVRVLRSVLDEFETGNERSEPPRTAQA